MIAWKLKSEMGSDETNVPEESYTYSHGPDQYEIFNLELRFYDMDNDGNNKPAFFKRYSKQALKILKPYQKQLEENGIKFQIVDCEKGWFPIEFTWGGK